MKVRAKGGKEEGEGGEGMGEGEKGGEAWGYFLRGRNQKGN